MKIELWQIRRCWRPVQAALGQVQQQQQWFHQVEKMVDFMQEWLQVCKPVREADLDVPQVRRPLPQCEDLLPRPRAQWDGRDELQVDPHQPGHIVAKCQFLNSNKGHFYYKKSVQINYGEIRAQPHHTWLVCFWDFSLGMLSFRKMSEFFQNTFCVLHIFKFHTFFTFCLCGRTKLRLWKPPLPSLAARMVSGQKVSAAAASQDHWHIRASWR